MADRQSYTNSAVKSTAWKLSERIFAQLVTLVVSIIIARILGPEEYGVIGIITIFFSFANIFITNGFCTALIQKKDADSLDYSTTLISSLLLSGFLYFILYFFAPVVSALYQNKGLTSMLRVMGLALPINAVKSVICAYISSRFLFKKFFFATLIGTVISSIAGIACAMNGFGAWSLIIQQLSNSFFDTVMLIAFVGVFWGLRFSTERFKGIFGYSWGIMVSGVLGTTYSEVTPFAIGLRYSTSDLAFYTKGKSFPVLISSSTTSTLSAVLFPFLSKCQDDKKQLLSYTRAFIRDASFFSFPMMLGFLAVANNFILVTLGAEWLSCVPYIYIFCLTGMFDIIHVGNCEAIKAMGRSKTYLIMEIIKKSSYACIILSFLLFATSPVVLSCSFLLCTVVAIVVNSVPNIRFLGYGVKDQFLDIAPNLVTAILMGLAVFALNYLSIDPFILLIIQLTVGALLYFSLAYITKNRSMKHSLGLIKKLFAK